MHIDGAEEKLEAMRQLLIDPGSVEFSPDERKVMTLCMLLEADEPAKLYALSRDLKVTVPTVTSDLDELENLIEKSGLALVRKKRLWRGSQRCRREQAESDLPACEKSFG